MLVLSRKNQESVVVGDSDVSPRLLKVTVLGIQGALVLARAVGDEGIFTRALARLKSELREQGT